MGKKQFCHLFYFKNNSSNKINTQITSAAYFIQQADPKTKTTSCCRSPTIHTSCLTYFRTLQGTCIAKLRLYYDCTSVLSDQLPEQIYKECLNPNFAK